MVKGLLDSLREPGLRTAALPPSTRFGTISTASGQRKWLSVSILVARMRRGPSPLTVHLLRDIDRRKKAERLSREIVARLSELSGQQAVAHLGNGLPDQPPVSLTPREISALSLLSQGRSTRQMAGELDITLATARNHVQRALRKLRCHSRLEAVLRATRLVYRFIKLYSSQTRSPAARTSSSGERRGRR